MHRLRAASCVQRAGRSLRAVGGGRGARPESRTLGGNSAPFGAFQARMDAVSPAVHAQQREFGDGEGATGAGGTGNMPPSGGGEGSGAAEPAATHGLSQWEAIRAEWTKRPEGYRKQSAPRPVLPSDATYEGLLLSSRPFPRPVPLPEMVEFLVDCWVEDGLYD
ncbi:unnamed protein product [Pedinophyceae sp. YPF-701]|nr:unnamed protein product [Pedinophyceae sp. YPF-701]